MRLFAVVFLLLWGGAPAFAQGDQGITPFYTSNLSPVVQIHGLPAAESGELARPGKLSLRVVAEVASHYTKKKKGPESVLFDGETSRVIASIRYGLTDRWEAGLDVPLLSHDGGVLDGFIEGWHDFFGMPQNGRDKVRRNQLRYSYNRNTTPAVDHAGSNGGFGDVSLAASYQLLESRAGARRSVAVRGGVKLPTGNSDELRGSGAPAVHGRLTATDAQTLQALNGTLFASAGVMWLGKGDVLADQQRQWVGFGSIGIGWMPLSWVDFKLQLDGHTSFYKNSDLTQINSPSVQLGVGGTLHFSERISLDLAVTEDIIVDSAPDVVFHSALNWRF